MCVLVKSKSFNDALCSPDTQLNTSQPNPEVNTESDLRNPLTFLTTRETNNVRQPKASDSKNVKLQIDSGASSENTQ